MKKFLIPFACLIFTFSISACRETTKDKTKDALESAGKDIKDAADKTGDALEKGADNVKRKTDSLAKEAKRK